MDMELYEQMKRVRIDENEWAGESLKKNTGKLVEAVEKLGIGITLAGVSTTGRQEFLLEFSDGKKTLMAYVNTRFITMGCKPFYTFSKLFTCGSTLTGLAVGYVKKFFGK